MTSKQRSYLKSLAQKIDSIFQIGKNGLTPEVTEAIDLALEAREIVKISVLQNCLEDPRDIAGMLSERTKSITVQVIGKKIVLYRPSKKNPKITL
ncbi:ribosome assembly RNA-binding protein YhbY [Cellulosilyticum ruminicola]|uniref:ribosome assembly RNA-binding protein YhbY n=1 Tax=Cellulosilyticum ruminicola TaxID=425254 RepID=UPI002FE658BE